MSLKDKEYILIENFEPFCHSRDIKQAILEFKVNIQTLYDKETQEQINHFIKEIFGDWEK